MYWDIDSIELLAVNKGAELLITLKRKLKGVRTLNYIK